MLSNYLFSLYLLHFFSSYNCLHIEFSPKEIDAKQVRDWDYVSNVLAMDGIVAISGLNSSYTTSLSLFKRSYDICQEETVETGALIPSLTSVLPDGTKRVTVALKSLKNFQFCQHQETNDMANHIRKVYSSIQSDLLLGMSNGNEFLKASMEEESLDHFHYYNKMILKSSDEKMAIDFHKDKGLFLLLSPSPGLLIRRQSDNKIYTVATNPSNILLLVGTGLTSVPVGNKIGNLGKSACEHGVEMTSNKRLTIARMILPSKSFGDFWDYFHSSGTDANLNLKNGVTAKDTKWDNTTVKTASRNNMRERNLVECAAGEVYCWMQCQATNCDSSAVCWDYTNHVTCPTSGMQPQCKLKCPTESHINKTQRHFCTGSTSMFMEGFDVSYEHEETPCVILFFTAWTLDTALKFSFGCIGVFLLGLSMEGLLVLRRRWRKYVQTLPQSVHWKYKLVTWLLVWLAIGVGYLCMLVAMTYSMELFLFVISGLATGHILGRNDFESLTESAEPCCAAMDDDVTPNDFENKMTTDLEHDRVVSATAVKNDWI